MIACPACGAENVEGSRFCNACGERFPETTPAPEVRKTVTIIFCDVSGSTALGERLDPESLRRVMSRYFEAMTAAIEAHGGTVEKFIGDAVMAVFGIPVAHEDDALRAVRAAADMREGLATLNKELERDHGATLACRIGINTGEVVAGDATARQSIVVGDAVNVAARLEQAAPPGGIYLSGTTLELVRDAVVAEEVAPLDLKGKTDPVPAHLLVEVHPGARGRARRFDTPLVGRERQLAQLRQVFDEVAAERVCSLFTLMAPPGTGKSRLVREFLATVDGAATVLRGRCLAYGDGIAFVPVADLVRDAIGDDGAEPNESVRALLPADEHADRIAATLGTLLVGDPSPAEEITWATRRLFEAVARERPVAVVFDDIQWADPQLLDLIDHVSEWSRDAPILLLCMARPELLEVRPEWGGGKHRATNATLEPLTPTEADELVRALAGGALDPGTRTRILDAAEGNPLFVEEIVAMFTDDANVVVAEQTPIPATIQALLTARLDALGEADRAVLGRASIVGEVFYLDAVRALAPEAERERTGGLVRGLLRRELVRPESSDLPGQEAYRFHHALLRDAAYAMVPKETRADLHEALTAWLDDREGFEADEFVGYHLGRAAGLRAELGLATGRTATLAARAAARLSRAGARAADREDIEAARVLFARSAELHAPSTAEAGWDLFRYVWALLDRDFVDDVRDALGAARGAAEASQDARLAANLEVTEAYVRGLFEPAGSVEALKVVTERLRPRFEAAGDDATLAVIWLVAMQEPWILCRFGEAREMAARSMGHATAAGNDVFVRRSINFRGAAGWYGPTPIQVLLEETADRVSMPGVATMTLAMITNARGAMFGMLGRDDESDDAFARADRLATDFLGEVPPALGPSRAVLAEVRDRPLEALVPLEGLYEGTRRRRDLAHQSTLAGTLASLLVTLERSDEARPYLEECRTLGHPTDMLNEVLWRRTTARIAAREGDAVGARDLMAAAVELVERTDMLLDIAETWLLRAEVEERLGDREAARAGLVRAADAYHAKGAVIGEDRVHRRLAALDTS